MKRLFILGLLLAGCQTVTVRPDGGLRSEAEPDFTSREHFFLWGLVPGERFVNVTAACAGKDVTQLQAQQTFLDGFLGAITFGIYTPRSAHVWCAKSKATAQVSEEIQ